MFKNHIIYFTILSVFLLTSCSNTTPRYNHGINSLDNRYKLLVVNESNQNDVISSLGSPHSTGISDENTWLYFERVITKSNIYKLGKNELSKNNIVKLKFDKYGLLVSKDILDKNEMNKVKYSKEFTKNTRTSESFVNKFLQSVKQKMYSNNKTK